LSKLSKLLRSKYPKFYKLYQEIIGEIYYENLGIGYLIRLFSKKRLQQLENVYQDPIKVVFNFKGIGPYKSIRPFQITPEISELFNIVKGLNPKVVCEIGTDLGGTLYLWSKAMQSGGLLISIDLPRLYRKSLNRFLYSFFARTQKIFFLRENSHSLECLSKIQKILGDKKIDFLFIDGDHSYEGVKQDFLFYAKYVRKGGIIAFHDIMKDNLPGNICDVDKFWARIKTVYQHREIVADRKQIGAGIGIIYYDPEKTYERSI
jgi:predicted O-methyltransferase YrrM